MVYQYLCVQQEGVGGSVVLQQLEVLVALDITEEEEEE
jgi:hypothetical protein